MPVIRYFIVEQVRQVKISCNTPEQAAAVATHVFNNDIFATDPAISIQSPVRVTQLNVTEDR